MKKMTKGVKWALWSVLLLGGMGCAGYRLGPVNGVAAGARSVQVKFFDNQTLEPRLVSAVNHSLRQRLQQQKLGHC